MDEVCPVSTRVVESIIRKQKTYCESCAVPKKVPDLDTNFLIL